MSTFKNQIVTILLAILMSSIFFSAGYFGLHYAYEHAVLYNSNSTEVFNILRPAETTTNSVFIEMVMLGVAGLFGILVLCLLTFFAKRTYVTFITGAALVAVFALLAINFKSSNEVQYEVMNKSYNILSKSYFGFEQSNSGLFMKKAIEDKNIEEFYNIINKRDYVKTRLVDRIKILSIIEQLFPELKNQIVTYTADNYLSIYEYNELKKAILLAAANKKLSPNQSVLLGDIK